jgi:hypothetical protein
MMGFFLRSAVLSFSVFFLMGAVPASAATSRDICSNQPIPAGYVITAWRTASACHTQGNTPNTVTIRAYAGLSVLDACINQPIPPGFVVTAYKTSDACSAISGNSINTSTFRAYADRVSLDACTNQPIPPGFVIVAYKATGICLPAKSLQ